MAEGLNFLELFLGDEAAWHATLGFGDEAFAIFFRWLVRNPGRVVTLVARPLNIAPVDVYVDLIFAFDRISVPPTKRDTHVGIFAEAGVSARANSAMTGPGRKFPARATMRRTVS